MLSYLLLSIATALIGWYVSKEKGRNTTLGFLLGFFFNLTGVLVVAIMPSKIDHNQFSLKKKVLNKNTAKHTIVRKYSTEIYKKRFF
jgi:hypothetical protein